MIHQKKIQLSSLIGRPPSGSFHYTKEISKNTKENFESQFLKFQEIKRIQKLFNGIGQHSWGADASFDTHIAISIYETSQMAYASNMAFLAFLT